MFLFLTMKIFLMVFVRYFLACKLHVKVITTFIRRARDASGTDHRMALRDIHFSYLQASSLPLAKEALVHFGGLLHLVKDVTLGTLALMPTSIN